MTSAATRRRIEGARPNRQAQPLTAAETVAMVEAMPTSVLLTTAYALTHRIHECTGSTVAGQCDGPCTEQRAQRDLITAEVLRRTGGE